MLHVDVRGDVERSKTHQRVARGRSVEQVAEEGEVHLSEVARRLLGPASQEQAFVMVAYDVVRERDVIGPVFAVEEAIEPIDL